MKKLIALAAFAAFTAMGQTQTAKPETPAPKIEVPTVAPKLDSTAKLWRLLATSQSLQDQLSQSEIGKKKADVDQQLQAEQQRLSGICSASRGWMLGTQADAKAENAGDVVCVRVPDPPKAEAAKPEAKK
jgi:hypothetical protein